MKEDVIATKPHIKVTPLGKWYVYFSVRNPKTGKLIPVKKEKGFKICTNDKARLKQGENLIKEYTHKIKNGWTPWSDDEYIFEDQIMYHSEAEAYGTRRKKSKTSIRLYASEFLLFKKQSLKSKGYSSYQSKFRIFTHWLEKSNYIDYDITEISNDVILLFFEYLISQRDLDKVTIKGYKVRINAMFQWLVNKHIIKNNPVYNIPIGTKKCDKSPRPILPGDIDELLDKIEANDLQLYLACLMQYFCAIRPGTELRLLKIKDIDFWNGSIKINILDSKNQRDEVITMPNQLQQIMTNTYHLHKYDKELYVFSINGIPGQKPLGKNNLRMRFNKYRDELNLCEDYKFYSFKHTGAGMMLNCKEFNIRELMEHLRHTDINSTYHYIRRYRGSNPEKIKENFPDPRMTSITQ